MPDVPKILSTKIAAESRLFRIEQVELEFSNGEHRLFERIRGHARGAVMIAPMLDDDTIMLIREYGAGIHDYYLGLPKGLIEHDEDIMVAADRELKEEIGYGAKKLTLLKNMTTAPGYFGRGMQLVLAQNLYPEKLAGDEPEEIEVVPWKLSNLAELIARDDFCESRSIAALYLIRDLLND